MPHAERIGAAGSPLPARARRAIVGNMKTILIIVLLPGALRRAVAARGDARAAVAALLVLAVALPGAAAAAPSSGPDITAEVELGAAPEFAPEHGKAATADASPVAPGALELEIAYAPIWNDGGAAAGFAQAQAGYTHALDATATYGVVRDVDVKVSSVFASTYDAAHVHPDGSTPKQGTGVGDLTVGGRWRFLDAPERSLELAAIGELVLPVGTRSTATRIGLSQEFWSARLALAATKDLGRATMNAEVACMAPLSGDGHGPGAIVQANLAAGHHLLAWLQPELEVNYQASLGTGSQVLAVTAGVIAPWGVNRVIAALQQGLWGRNAVQTTGAFFAFKTAI